LIIIAVVLKKYTQGEEEWFPVKHRLKKVRGTGETNITFSKLTVFRLKVHFLPISHLKTN